jgi:hypothetical protein
VYVNAFQALPQSLHPALLEGVGYFMGCKRSLFSEQDRLTYCSRLIYAGIQLMKYPFEGEIFSGTKSFYDRAIESVLQICHGVFVGFEECRRFLNVSFQIFGIFNDKIRSS